MSDTIKAMLLIGPIGTIVPALCYLGGYDVWAIAASSLIPLTLCSGGIYWILAGPRGREIAANLTSAEKQQLGDMVTVSVRSIRIPVVGLALPFAVFCAMILNPPEFAQDFVMTYQWELQLVSLVVLPIVWFITWPTWAKLYRAKKDFMMQTEYARRMGYVPQDNKCASK